MDKPGTFDRLRHISVQRYNLITVVRQVQHRRPVKVRTGKVDGTQFKFHSLVVEPADIRQVIQETGGSTDRSIVKQIFGIAVVIFEAHKDTVDKSQVETDIEIVILFPLQTGIGLGRFIRTCGSHIVLSVTVQPHISIKSSRLITVDTIGSTDFHIIQYRLHSVHKRLVAQMPHTGNRPEITPPAFGSKTGTTVTTVTARNVVTVVIIIIQTGEVRNHPVCLRRRSKAFQHGCIIRFEQHIRRELGFLSHRFIALVAFQFISCQYIKMVLGGKCTGIVE